MDIAERLAAALEAALHASFDTDDRTWRGEAEAALADFNSGSWRHKQESTTTTGSITVRDFPAVEQASRKLHIAAVAARELIDDIRVNSVLELYFTGDDDWVPNGNDTDDDEDDDDDGESLDERPRTQQEVIAEFTRAMREESSYEIESERAGTGTEVLQILDIAINAYNGSKLSRNSEPLSLRKE